LVGGEEELESDAMDQNGDWGFSRKSRRKRERKYLLMAPGYERDKDGTGVI
jgi:hypothetical protein